MQSLMDQSDDEYHNDLCFDILDDLADDLIFDDYFRFLGINELSYGIASCNVLRLVDYYYTNHIISWNGCDRIWLMVDHICYNRDFEVFKWHYYNSKVHNPTRFMIDFIKEAIICDNHNFIKWVDKIGDYSEDIVHHASKMGNLNILKWGHYDKGWLEKINKFGIKYINACIQGTSQNGHLDIVRWLICESGVRSQDACWIDCACEGGYFDIVEWLHQNFTGDLRCSSSALICAFKYNNPHIADYLYSKHDELRTVKEMKKMAHDACQHHNIGAIEFAFDKMASFAPTGDDVTEFVKNKMTGHIVKRVGLYSMKERDKVLELLRSYGFRT